MGAVCKKELKDRLAQIERHIKVEMEYTIGEVHECQKKTEIYTNLDTHCNALMDIMTKFESMGNCYRGTIVVAKLQFELASNGP